MSEAELAEAYRANALFDAHADDPQFGHRLLADEARDLGQDMCDRTARVDLLRKPLVVYFWEEEKQDREQTGPTSS